jgi:cysteine-rich repeat protein
MTPSSRIVGILAVAAFVILTSARPAAAGGLSFVEFDAPPPGNTNNALKNVSDVAVSPDGANVYTASSNPEDSIGVFTRNLTTGALTFLEIKEDGVGGVDGLHRVSAVTVSPDGNCVYATGEQDNEVAVFSRNLGTGALTFVETESVNSGRAVVASPDNLHVYALGDTGGNQGAIEVFSRAGCGLTFVEEETGDTDGLGKQPEAMAITANGAHIYTGGTFFDGKDTQGAVNVFSRNAVTGQLTFVEREYNGNNGIDRLSGVVSGVAVSPDGLSVYAASRGDSAILVFSRNAGTGNITIVETQRDGGVVDGLKGVSAVAVSPDGAYVYAVGHAEDAVSVFRRNTATGTLRFLEVQKDPLVDPPNEVLQGVESAAVSAAGDSLYVANKGVTVLAVDSCGNGNVGPDEQCDDGNVVGGDGCSATCRLELCGAAPSGGCRGTMPLGAALKIKNISPDSKDQLQWKWSKGDATTFVEYGSPTTSTSYVLCVYDSSANPQPLLASAAPADGTCKKGKLCWKAGTTSYKYNDGLLTPDGLQGVSLKEGLVNGKAKIQFKGKGINLLPPSLPLTLPVTVQVKNTTNAVCWEAVYPAADTNDGVQFKAKGD